MRGSSWVNVMGDVQDSGQWRVCRLWKGDCGGRVGADAGVHLADSCPKLRASQVVECAPASPCTYSSSTHRFPDERKPIETTSLSVTSAELGLGLGLGLGLDSLSHSSSHALPFFSTPSFHTLSLSPVFTSVWWSA
jgi:hypothetical protein